MPTEVGVRKAGGGANALLKVTAASGTTLCQIIEVREPPALA
jgi:hypothetical protein